MAKGRVNVVLDALADHSPTMVPLSALVVYEFMDENGNGTLAWFHEGSPRPWAMLGMADWLAQQVSERLSDESIDLKDS